MLERCRQLGHRPAVPFTSSVAVYGGMLPTPVRDDPVLTPSSSYGVQKAIGEILLADYTHRGFVAGRALRPPTIGVRPGRSHAAASSFASSLIRGPLAGARLCARSQRIPRCGCCHRRGPCRACAWHGSGRRAALGAWPVLVLPGLSVTPCERGASLSLSRVAGAEAAARVRWQRDSRIDAIVASWPAAWDDSRARALGFSGDADFDAIVQQYREDSATRR